MNKSLWAAWIVILCLLCLSMVLFLFTGERDALPALCFYSLPLRKEQKDGGKGPLI